MKKILALMLVVCMFLMSGCMLVDMSVTIQPDGSGKMGVVAGFAEDSMREMIKMMGKGMSDKELEAAFQESVKEMQRMEKDGVVYYVATSEGQPEQELPFSSIRELNTFLFQNSATGEMGMETDVMSIKRNEDGSLTFTLSVPNGFETVKEEAVKESAEEIGEELGKAMVGSMVIGYSFDFPKAVKQVSGTSAGVVIDGNSLFVDLVKIMKEVDKSGPQTLEFVTEPDAVAPTKLLFSDVTEDKWYYDAVVQMAKDGVVNGMGDGIFAPESTMTYAQFCQLLAKTMGAEVGEENGYWAAKAIQFCLDYELILSRGEVTPANYDVPITREAAISARYRLTSSTVATVVEEPSIPDFNTISEVYREDIIGAYRVGLTTGVDEDGTFMPKAELRRAEVCQLYYNMWN